MELQQQRYLDRYNNPHPYEESGRHYGCQCGRKLSDAIHHNQGVARNEFVLSHLAQEKLELARVAEWVRSVPRLGGLVKCRFCGDISVHGVQYKPGDWVPAKPAKYTREHINQLLESGEINSKRAHEMLCEVADNAKVTPQSAKVGQVDGDCKPCVDGMARTNSSCPKQKFYLTTPIYYVNARPHIGHAYTTIAADVIARRHRLLGDDTFFLTGTDEHGQKIERSAAAVGIPPQQFADQVSIEFRNLWNRMGLTYDDYIRTTEPRHQQGAQRLFALLHQRGQIYLSSYTGQYSVGEEIFIEGPPGVLGPDGKPTETVTEENFFFRLSEYQLPLIDLIESDTLLIQPESRKNEVLSFLRGNVTEATDRGEVIAVSASGRPYVPGNLRDLSVSRSSFTWGIPVPEPAASETKQKHVIYVWLDALANYMTAVGYGSDKPEDIAKFNNYWPADLHTMAKEITRQHCIYWPAFLLAAGLPPPKAVTAHGWLLFDDSKMSKSKGNIVRTETILDAFGTLKPKPEDLPGAVLSDEYWKKEQDFFASDVLRYFLLREIPFGQDGSFSFDALVQRYNSDLANGYGNLVSRTLSMIRQYFSFGDVVGRPGGTTTIPDLEDKLTVLPTNESLRKIIETGVAQSSQNFGQYEFGKALEQIWGLVAATDAFITSEAPWKLAKIGSAESATRLRQVLYSAAESIRIITALAHPFIPYTTSKVWAQLGLRNIAEADTFTKLSWGGLDPGITELGELSPIFPRAPKELIQLMTDMENNTNTTPNFLGKQS